MYGETFYGTSICCYILQVTKTPIYWYNPKFLDKPAVISLKKFPMYRNGSALLDIHVWTNNVDPDQTESA